MYILHLLVLLGTATAFTVPKSVSPPALNSALSATTPVSRSAFLKSAFVLPLLTTLPSPAFAKFGASIYPSPSEAVVDKDVLGSDAVQKSLNNVKGYLSTARGLKDEVSKNSQADIIPGIRSGFEFSALRSDLNTITTIFDEETQRATDRVNRVIMQDITELEASAKFKGEGRSEIRLKNVVAKLDKLEKAFEELLAFV
mmetsp:Transcript_6266/g.11892  ORF Transcript_6266/g.11892 Transcript_6266/m.11892 type:complete len:199 (+) Transcript_6266:32-628(+)|eukprot:CAMPEP_0197551682 /NCGR_PEP_ID=MMETSP1320-20131121/5229_1 /TAXON_ID=91990 /ORGANISM="Bolidomonas sp., Strain RCC2347" /LENGTH=198 /DNA_ID=CAMNT_0043112213 /DNA_START=31 /DNA_END=627 /DNA_ORIENTATION=+